MSAHTNGPWEIDGHLYGSGGAIWGPDGMTVCHVTDRGGGTRANARLIAAAPDLLAACRRAADHLLETTSTPEGAAVLEALVAAIVKAGARS